MNPPSPYEGFVIASQLLNSDGCKTFRSFFRTGEWNDPGATQMTFYMKLPRLFKYVYYLWVKYVRRDDIWAGLLRHWHGKSAYEQWKWVARREAYKAKWHEWWEQEAHIDFMLTPPNATPAVPHEGMKDAVSSCGYTFLFNLVSRRTTRYSNNLVITELARLHLRHHSRHPRRSSERPTAPHIPLQGLERRCQGSLQALRRGQDARPPRRRPSRRPTPRRRKSARHHAAHRRRA